MRKSWVPGRRFPGAFLIFAIPRNRSAEENPKVAAGNAGRASAGHKGYVAVAGITFLSGPRGAAETGGGPLLSRCAA